jgi:phosphinothricin acetyltransferase
MNDLIVHPIEEKHLPQIAEIFNHYVVNTTFSFHVAPVDLATMRVKAGLDRQPISSFGLFDGEGVLGYSLLNPWKAPEAYRRSAEISVYLHPDRIAQGHGLTLLEHTEMQARERGLRMLIAGICTENERSTKFFERSGYTQCAHFRSIGEKFGRELDVIYLQKPLERS